MVNGKIAGQSRWILQALWFIAAALIVTILTVRDKGVLTEPQLLLAGVEPDAAMAFAVPISSSATEHALDLLTWNDHAPVAVKPGVHVAVVAGTRVSLSGWAFDTTANADYAAIGAKISGSPEIFSAVVHLPRPDVAAALRNSAAQTSGFTLNIDTSHLALGRHVVDIHALWLNRESASLLEPAIAVDITNQSAAVQRTDAIDSVNGVIVNAAASANSPIAVLRSYGRLSVSGWGFVTQDERLASSITLLVDGGLAGAARYGLSRPDVALQFHDVRVTRSGFEGTLQTGSLTPGLHEIQLQLGLSDGTTIPSASTLHVNLQ